MIRVLIVDDEAPAREKLRLWLGAQDDIDIVGEASDGLKAAQAIEALQPDAVYLDIQMPGLDGLQVLGYVMSESPRPVIILTAAGNRHNDDLTLRALELGAVDFVRKPAPDEGLRPMDDRRSELERILLANPSDAASRREYAELLLEAGDAQAARVQFELLAARPSGAETAGLRVMAARISLVLVLVLLITSGGAG